MALLNVMFLCRALPALLDSDEVSNQITDIISVDLVTSIHEYSVEESYPFCMSV